MAIISKPYAETVPRKSWALVKNCDLLELLHEASHQTNRKSITGTWGKGHCTVDDVKLAEIRILGLRETIGRTNLHTRRG